MAERQEGKNLGYGAVKTPGGHYIDPFGSIADAKDVNAIAGDIQDIQWGAGQLNRGIAQARGHKASVIGMAKANVFEFPVFISDSVPLDYATATNTLLEQVYAGYLQMAISINPVVDYKMIQSRQNSSQFSRYKTNTTDYIECVDLTFQKDACHNVIFNDDESMMFEFDMCSIEDSDAKIMLEALDYQPLSEFDHYFMEAADPRDAMENWQAYVRHDRNGAAYMMMPRFDTNGNPVMRNGKLDLERIGLQDVSFNTNRTQANVVTNQEYVNRMALIRKYLNNATITVDFGNGVQKSYKPSELEREVNIQKLIKGVRENDPKGDIRKKQRADASNAQRENLAKGKKMRDLVDSNGNLINPKNMNQNERDAAIQALNLLQAEADAKAEKESISNIKRKIANNEDLSTIELRKYQNLLNVKKAEREERDADEKFGDEQLNKSQLKGHLDAEALRDIRKAREAQNNLAAAMNVRDSKGNYTPEALALRRGFFGGNDLAGQSISADALEGRLKGAKIQADFIKDENIRNQYVAYQNFAAKYGVTPDELENESKLNREGREQEKAAREKRKEEYETKAGKAPQFIDENKLKKMNTMKPLMMTVYMSIMAQDGHVSHPMEYVVGVRTHCRIIKSSMLPEVVQYPIKEMNKISRKAKWRAGELKFWKDIMFHVKEKKQTAIDSKDPNRKWYRRLYELAHMKGDGNVSKKISGAGYTDGLIPNATVIISKSDVDHIEEVTKIDMLKASNAIDFCEQLFLIGFIVIDIDHESIKILIPELNNEFDVQSLAAVNKQIAELDTAGKSTRDIFKMLK